MNREAQRSTRTRLGSKRTLLLSMCSVLALSTVAAAQDEWRVSVKFILSSEGKRPVGRHNSDVEIEERIRSANEVLARTTLGARLRLTEILEVRGASQWFETPCPESERDKFEAEARSKRDQYFWRNDAINVYIVSRMVGDCGGICSFPATGSIIIIGQNSGTDVLLHEIGHFMGLAHTQSVQQTPAQGFGREDILADDPDWSQDDIALKEYGTTYEDLNRASRLRVDTTYFNIMSYHGKKNCLSEAQVEEMRRNANGPRRSVVDQGGIIGSAERNDRFGTALATGDFNGDGFDDQAIGSPDEDYGRTDAGVVNVLYGSVDGPQSHGSQLWHQYSPGIAGGLETGDGFGDTLASGDFNGDGFDDLAIGVPNEGIGSKAWAGAVHILFGSKYGLNAQGSKLLYQGARGIPGRPVKDDQFGRALVAADFDNDGFDDLAIGVPGDDTSTTNAGTVQILWGSSTGGSAWATWHLGLNQYDTPGMGDALGSSLAAGDFNKDGFADLVIGVDRRDVDGHVDAGMVVVLHGSSLRTMNPKRNLYQHQQVLSGRTEAFDRFGRVLATGDLNRDGHDDLVVGVPDENSAAGMINIIYGSRTGLTTTRNKYYRQGWSNLVDQAQPGDQFGYSLVVADVDRDSYADIIVGVPFDDPMVRESAGLIHILFGSANGVTATDNLVIGQNGLLAPGDAETGDNFGFSLAAGDFDGNGYVDILVGSPGEGLGSRAYAGSCSILYSWRHGEPSHAHLLRQRD